jgi:hypothetical protein
MTITAFALLIRNFSNYIFLKRVVPPNSRVSPSIEIIPGIFLEAQRYLI